MRMAIQDAVKSMRDDLALGCTADKDFKSLTEAMIVNYLEMLECIVKQVEDHSIGCECRCCVALEKSRELDNGLCPQCGGTGNRSSEVMARYGAKPHQCDMCKGTGRFP